jgi:protease II
VSRRIVQRAVALSIFVPLLVLAQDRVPVIPAGVVETTYFGTTVADPYRHLENLKNPEVAQWMRAQSDYTRRTMHRIPGRAALLQEVQRYGDAAIARVQNVRMVGSNIYYEKLSADLNVPKLYVRDGFDGQERLLVDPDAFSASGVGHFALDYYAPSPDNKYLAYGVSAGGSKQRSAHHRCRHWQPTSDVIDPPKVRHRRGCLTDGCCISACRSSRRTRRQATTSQSTLVHSRHGHRADTDVALFGAGSLEINIAATNRVM